MHTGPSAHGSATRATVLWLLLIGATVVTWILGEGGGGGLSILVILAVLSCAKGCIVILDFMALRRAPLMWPVLTLGWVALVWAVIALAYWNGMPK